MTRIEINGAQGEGGGQVLRSSLSLSIATGQPFVIRAIRAGRKKPGLLRQHLASVRAAARVGAARMEGDELGSQELLFEPTGVHHGEYRFAVGTAGSATLVLQTVLAPLLAVAGRSRVVVEGGTHNPWAPPYEYLVHCLFPALERMGGKVSARLERHGFFPAGGGRIDVEIEGAPLRPASFLDRGALLSRSARALVSNLPEKVALREVNVAKGRLGLSSHELEVVNVDSAGPGNALLLDWRFEHAREIVSGFGQKRVSAEKVAGAAVDEMHAFLASDAPLGPHLADQLMVPMALAGGGTLHTSALSSHASTNLDVLKAFFPALEVRLERRGSVVVFLTI